MLLPYLLPEILLSSSPMLLGFVPSTFLFDTHLTPLARWLTPAS